MFSAAAADEGSAAAAGWVAFERAGDIAFGRAAAFSKKSLRLTDGGKIPRHRLWLCGAPPDDAAYAAARRLSEEVAAGFIWRAAAGRALSLADLAAAAAAAHGGGGGDIVWRLATARILIRQPFYFRRCGEVLKPQPAELLEKMLQTKQARDEQRAREDALIAALAAGETPPEIAAAAAMLLYAPQKDAVVYRALKRHAGGDGAAFADFFISTGALADARAYWGGMFRRDWPAAAADADAECAPPPLPAQAVAARAFSIDDADTVEVDDAFSLSEQENGDWRIGIHIAAPALAPPDAADIAARRRLISVYFPDEKHCMLPPAHIAAYSLCADAPRPALSLYVYFSPATGAWRAGETALEAVRLTARLTPAQAEAGDMPPDLAGDYKKLLRAAAAMAADDSAPAPAAAREFDDFKITAAPAVIRRAHKQTTALVAALMRMVNSVWGRMLSDAGIGGFYRADGAVKTRLAAGATPYMWLSSPLRRYPDLLNQRLLLAHIRGAPPPREDWRGLAAAFERQHALARRYQQIMERHWAMRALAARADDTPLPARRIAKERARLLDYPLTAHCAGAPDGDFAARVRDMDFVRQQLRLVPA